MKNYKSYPKYKDSGIPWLGKIPEHWVVKRARRIFNERSVKGFQNEPLLAATQSKGVVLKSKYENRTVVAQNNLETLKLVEEGDFVISLRSFQGGIELAHDKGIISPAYTVLRLKNKDKVDYFKYLLKSKQYIDSLTLLVTGIREGQNIDTSKFKESLLFTPSPTEQITIANFLDYKLSKTNRFIRKKKQLIELLNEQKAAIINQAVTKGLDPNFKMKESGVEWLGEIPEHWEVRKLKYVAKVCNGSECDKQSEGLYPVYGSGGIFGYHSEYLYDKPSVLLGRKGTLNRPIYVDVPFWTVDTAFYTKIKEDSILPYYFYLACTTINFDYYSTKTALPSMTQTSLYNVKFGLPPLPEQQQIVSHIEQETARLNAIISKIEKEIVLVEEFKTALIAEAVTGKIDVRDFVVPDFGEGYLEEEENDNDLENAEEHQTIEE